MRKLHWAGIVVVVIFVGLLALGAAVGPSQQNTITSQSAAQSTLNTTSQGSTSLGSSSSTSSASSSSNTVGTSNSCCTLRVTKTTIDNVLQPGSSYYYLSVDVGYSGSDSWLVVPFNFQVISNTGAVFSSTFSINALSELSTVTLKNGQHATGELAFLLPSGQTPVTLEYSALGFHIQAPIPPISSWVSSVNSISTVFRGPNASLSSIYAFGSVQNSTYYFRTGNIIAIKLAITYNPYGQPGSIVVTSITVSDNGFSISKIEPALPVTISGNSQESDIIVYLVAPASTYSGDIHLTLTFSYG